MSGIQRWECRVAINDNGRPYVDDIKYASGRYVLHSDHDAVVDSMTAALVKLDGACLASEQEIARLRAEVEKNRVDAERYRWLRNKAYMLDGMGPAVILAESDFPIDDHRTEGFVFHGELDKAIDAAMGASA